MQTNVIETICVRTNNFETGLLLIGEFVNLQKSTVGHEL